MCDRFVEAKGIAVDETGRRVRPLDLCFCYLFDRRQRHPASGLCACDLISMRKRHKQCQHGKNRQDQHDCYAEAQSLALWILWILRLLCMLRTLCILRILFFWCALRLRLLRSRRFLLIFAHLWV